jgi:hypothetical protein
MIEKMLDNEPFLERKFLPNLYSWKSLEEHINFRPALYPKRFKTFSKGEKKWKAGGWLTNYDTWPATYVKDELKEGVIFLKDCSRINKDINAICKNIEDITKWPTDCHIFISLKPLDKTGFGKHNDEQHNLIVAQEGKLEISVWDKNDELVIDTLLQNGDCVFVPAKCNHKVLPFDDKRYSFSFSMAPYEKFFQERDWIEV